MAWPFSMTSRWAAESTDNRLIACTRLVLASAALGASLVSVMGHNLGLIPLRGALVLYTLYSSTVYLLVLRNSPLVRSAESWLNWVDVGWYALLFSFSGGMNSHFLPVLFFPVIVASFQRGYASGLHVILATATLQVILGFATFARGLKLEPDRFLISFISLLVLGHLLAYFGGIENQLKGRLALLKEITSLSNPRFGIDRTIGSILERLRKSFSADTCLLIMADSGASGYSLRHADRNNPEAAMRAEVIAPGLAQALLEHPTKYAVIHCGRQRVWSRLATNSYAYDLEAGKRAEDGQKAVDALVALLDVKSFIAMPLSYSHNVVGTLYLFYQRQRAFHDSDIRFLHQLVGHVMPLIDNLRLVERLASDAAEEERRRIARDIHDSIIQPYIGLQLGLTGVRRKLSSEGTDVSCDIDRLIQMSSIGIADLRNTMSGLKGGGEQGESLLPAVRRFATKFSEATGIAVRVNGRVDNHVSDRLAAEAFQIVVEGMSNIRRHTQAELATVSLKCADGYLFLRIENNGAAGSVPLSFTPRSITERALALGGHARVESFGRDATAVVVEIPL
jgi:signal transduction histidine kinase